MARARVRTTRSGANGGGGYVQQLQAVATPSASFSLLEAFQTSKEGEWSGVDGS